MAEVADGTVVAGRYRILGRIGSGGMADVYLAQDSQLGREVALKVLHRRFSRDHQFVERFRREASAAASLQHPRVVGVYDRGEHDDTYYIVMENLPGRTLRDLLNEDAPLPQERAIHFGRQILEAAGFAHRRGVVHRDFKPHNVIVAPDDSLKVTDFGIARAGASEMTETGSIMGTAQYLSPEQAQGKHVDAASDIYSIGVMLYEMLVGRVPFEGDSAVSIALKHVSDTPTPIRELRPDVHPALEAAVMRALNKDPAQRYASAEEFIAALDAAREAISTGADGGFEGWMPPPIAEEREEEDEGRRWPWVTLVLLLLAAAAAAAFLLTRPDQVKVPDVVGKRSDQAAQELVDAGLKPRVLQVRSEKPVGVVVKQDPVAGREVEKTSAVTLSVSSGPGFTTVPDVTNLPQKEAVKQLEDAGLFATIHQEHSAEVSSGRVTRTDPPALNQVEKGSRVELYVSSGPELTEVPNVVGEDRADARAAIEDAKLKVTVHEEESSRPEGQVISQSPGAGSTVARGSRVTITVSKGVEKVRVPRVEGQSEEDARATLEDAGFSVVVRTEASSEPEGTVIRQSPSAGTELEKGGTVTIYTAVPENGGGEEPGGTDAGGGSPGPG
ncbi:MAG TPA: PASTA domain-containing protein [Thermoleophilaceae bacterium]|nr:PASTA domain-containing protein [Thermoleophilaceae bacterium]